MIWEILDTGVSSAEKNMQIDADLLASLDKHKQPLIHFYEWERDSATFGYFTDPAHFLDLSEADKQGLALARRSTGGGIVFHMWDLAFSLLVPASSPEFSMNTLENYAFVNHAVLMAVEEFLQNTGNLSLTKTDFQSRDPHCRYFCMAKPTKYDLVQNGQKIAGAAQRKAKNGFLHQGTIALVMPPEEYLRAILLPGTEVLTAMKAFTFPLLGEGARRNEITQAKKTLKALLTIHLNKASVRLHSLTK
jgi:lipoate-protein ligase A